MRGKSHLVGGLEPEFYDFPFSWEYIFPTDELHHFSEGWLNHQPVFYHNFTPDTGSHWEPEEIHELLDTLPAKAAEETQPALRLSDARKSMGDISIVNGAFKPT